MDSELKQWPVQLALVPENSPYFEKARLLVAADCVPFAFANFHSEFLQGKALVIGCPKLDNAESYIEKLSVIIKSNSIKEITVAHMEVPCCFGLQSIVKEAVEKAGSKAIVRQNIISVRGEIKN